MSDRSTMIGRLPLRRQILLTFGSVATVSALVSVGVLEAVRRGSHAPARPQLIQHHLSELAVALALGMLMSIVTTIGAAAVLRNAVSTELARMHDAALAIAAGRLDHRISSGRTDEFGRLAGDIDEMAARLQRAEQCRRQMLASVSHELRTPLTIIRGQAFTLARTEADAARRERLELIDEEVSRLSALVDDLLSSASATTDVIVLERSEADVTELLASAARRFEPIARDAGIDLCVECPEPLPDLRVDVVRMHQVIGNLLANAVVHAPAGSSIRLGARLRGRGRSAEITVTDAGPGIDPGLIDDVFEPFSQGEVPTGSVGLGLTIVRAFVHAHGGTVSVASAPGNTRFTITLPIERRSRARTTRTLRARLAGRVRIA